MNARVLRRAALALGLLAVLLVVALVGRLPGIGAEAVSTKDFTVTVRTSRSTPIGATSLTVTGASGSTGRTLALTLVVTAPAPPGLSVAVVPATVTVAPGATVTYAVDLAISNPNNQPLRIGNLGGKGVTVHLAYTGSATNR